ncbi:phospholipase-like protein [Tanacetum coccineum]
MDGVDIEDLTIEQYLRLTHESQTPKKIEDMTITEYLEYEKKVNENHISNTKSYLPTYFGKSVESNCDSEDMEEEVEYMTCDEVVMSEQEESNHGYTLNIKNLEGKDDVDKWLNAEITKHMNMHGVENMKDALISIIKSIRQEMKDDIMKRQFEALTTSVSDEVSSIASNEVDNVDNNTLNTAPCRLHKELIPGSFLLPFNINNHNLYDTTTLNAKDNIMPQRVYESFGLDKLGGTSTLENTRGTNEPLGTINILVKFGELEFLCNFVINMAEDVIILGRPFIESTHAQIDVFNEEISFEIHSKKFKFNIDSYQSIKKIYMVSIGQEEETFNPLEIGIGLFSYESHACLQFEQRTRSYGTTKPQDEIAGPDSLSPDRKGLVKKWHHGTLRQQICFRDHERRAVKGSYMGFDDFLQEKCQQNYKKTNEAWYDEGYEEDEMWQNGDEKTDYDPPYVNVKTFEVKKYSFKGGRSFICITDREDEALPLGRVNGARFKDMIRKELEGNKIQKLGGNYRG